MKQAIYPFIFIILLFSSCTKKVGVTDVRSGFIFGTCPTDACHAATIEEISHNRLIAAWFGGSYEGAKDVGIYLAKFNGIKWLQPQCLINPPIIDGDTLPCWNPVLFKSQSDRLYLFYKVGKNPREWFGAMITSEDEGDSWSDPEYLPDGIYGPIRNKPIELTPGIILCGSSTEGIEEDIWRVHNETYNEATESWEVIEVPNPKELDVIQPTFIPHKNDQVQMLCRSRHNKIVSSWSEDNGTSWSPLDTLDVANSNSGIDAIAIDQNLFLMVNNPLKQGPDWFYGRNVLDVEYSFDGINWNHLFDLENKEKGQFSYPAIIQTSDKTIHVLYTYNREGIKH
ncbi:sialidase family protein, partial [Carboxylicivirga caseinilyticus]|uniref:sialidase family protein n=1 Tax=Carboxylicivirga caseinilyticus TaxID=3417572 RepID=UPI003D359947|nr:exo-alpha-sialidase [Marinilabiliaceae bacterium A049]